MKHHRPAKSRVQIVRVSAILAVIVALAAGILGWYSQFAGRSGGGRASTTPGSSSPVRLNDSTPAGGRRLAFRPYDHTDASGFQVILAALEPWDPGASLEKISESWREPGPYHGFSCWAWDYRPLSWKAIRPSE
jgi:hypothetical protein